MSKTALVTGASKGIGAEIAIQLAKNGFNVAINYNKSKAEAEKVLQKIIDRGGHAHLLIGRASCQERV